ncbi:hypothetical protein BX070DRAFT_220434 [Coemansia spiralis]|nr:hypothetical protein BX070DRAFT_220434 [Coemansia spiralis]
MDKRGSYTAHSLCDYKPLQKCLKENDGDQSKCLKEWNEFQHMCRGRKYTSAAIRPSLAPTLGEDARECEECKLASK